MAVISIGADGAAAEPDAYVGIPTVGSNGREASSRLSRPRHHEAVSRMKLSNAGSVYWLTAEELQVEPGSQLGDPGG